MFHFYLFFTYVSKHDNNYIRIVECNYEETQGNCFISYPILYIEPRKHLTLHRDKWIFLFLFLVLLTSRGKQVFGMFTSGNVKNVLDVVIILKKS